MANAAAAAAAGSVVAVISEQRFISVGCGTKLSSTENYAQSDCWIVELL